MKKEKLYQKISVAAMFLILLGSFLLVFDRNQIYVFEQIGNITNNVPSQYNLTDARTYSCTVERPLEKTVILRLDDIAPNNNLDLMKNMIKEITKRSYGVSLAIIPSRLERSNKLIDWLQNIQENPLIELSQHGYDHSREEFSNLDYDGAVTKINLGKDIMVRLFGQVPINFIPPYNVDSNETIDALKDLGFKTFSGNQKEYTTTTFKYSTDEFVPAEKVLSECKADLDNNKVCVIMFHPQDFTVKGKIDEQRYGEFIKILDGLKNLNADVVNFRQAFCKEY